jgi:hypothetical protein
MCTILAFFNHTRAHTTYNLIPSGLALIQQKNSNNYRFYLNGDVNSHVLVLHVC